MEKIKYTVDPYNRLIAEKTRNKTDLPYFRKVLDGTFKLSRGNELIYHVKTPMNTDMDIPNQLRLKGKWSLTENHDLKISFDKKARETFGDQLTLGGEILDATGNSFLFALATRAKDGTRSVYILNLEGAWQADEKNRLRFRVKKENGRHDILTFDGAWEINKNHQIIYRFEKRDLIRKRTRLKIITLKGRWDIREKARISYILDGNTDSVFNFRTSAGIYKDNYIKYELGIGTSRRKRPIKRLVTLYGAWKIKKNIGLVFEVEYENKKAKEITFGIEAALAGKDSVVFKLKKALDAKDAEAELKLSRKILKGDGEVFLKALKSRKEAALYAGGAFRW